MSHLDMDTSVRKAMRNPAVPLDVVAPVERDHDSASASATTTPKIQITCQFRDGMAMVYDLKAGQRRIEIRVVASSASESWSLAMTVKTADAVRTETAEGATRREALTAIEQSSAKILSTEEWSGLRAALVEVRALERQ